MFLALLPLFAWALPCAPVTDVPGSPAPLPTLREFSAPSALPGSEGWLLAALLPLLPADVSVERDAFGSLIVRAAGSTGPCSRVIAVGIDEPGYVVGQIRDDGFLRLRFLGRSADAAYHLAREGRPALVLPSGRPGVVLVNSIHLKNPRPAAFEESDLWLDVGADSAGDVADLGIGLLDPVVLREVVAFGDRVAGPELGRRAAALALLTALRDVPRGQWRDGLAVAFVAQSVPGSGALGRGGEGLLRRLQPANVLLLAARDGGAEGAGLIDGPTNGGVKAVVSPVPGGVLTVPVSDATPPVADPDWKTLELRVEHAGSPVECVSAGDLAAFGAALRAEITR